MVYAQPFAVLMLLLVERQPIIHVLPGHTRSLGLPLAPHVPRAPHHPLGREFWLLVSRAWLGNLHSSPQGPLLACLVPPAHIRLLALLLALHVMQENTLPLARHWDVKTARQGNLLQLVRCRYRHALIAMAIQVRSRVGRALCAPLASIQG